MTPPADEDDDKPLVIRASAAKHRDDDDPTAIASPSARKTRPPPAGPDDPARYLGCVLGSYRPVELLGKGGMGFVFRAEHVKLEREVALKLLRADYARRRDAVLRFFQEAKTVNRVRHRNIVDVTDFVELDDGTTYIIMELLAGKSLGAWVRTGVDLPRALAVLVQICDGLAAAHAVGVVHRDLKPDNVIVIAQPDGGELVKLLDFGVAKLVDREDEDVGFQTAAGAVLGTPAYMSPEQAGGMEVDHRSDIYSLGAIMYELFTGQPMFRGRSFGEFVRKHLTEVIVPPSKTENGAWIEPRLEAVIMRCLMKDPNERYAQIDELREALFDLLGDDDDDQPTNVPTLRLTPPALPVIAAGTQLSGYYGEAAPPAAPATPLWMWVGGAGFAIAIGVTAALFYASRGDSSLHVDAPHVTPAPAQATETALAPAAPAPQLVELKFDSLPIGGVYEAGRSAERCKTPCAFTIDAAEGTKRTFVIRSDGYRDQPVEVDLTGAMREFHVTLDRLDPAGATAPAKTGGPPAAPAHVERRDDLENPAPAATSPGKPPAKPAAAPDQTDTLDPYHRHR